MRRSLTLVIGLIFCYKLGSGPFAKLRFALKDHPSLSLRLYATVTL